MHYLLLVEDSFTFEEYRRDSLRVVQGDRLFVLQSNPNYPAISDSGEVIEDGWVEVMRSPDVPSLCKFALEAWRGSAFTASGTISIGDIESRGFDVSQVSMDDVRAIAQNMGDESMMDQYWYSLEYACEQHGLQKLGDSSDDEEEDKLSSDEIDDLIAERNVDSDRLDTEPLQF